MSCLCPWFRSSKPLLEYSLIDAKVPESLFSKSKKALEIEFGELRRKSPHIEYALFSADHCLGRSLIVSQAPESDNIDHFLKLAYDNADVIIMLMQTVDYKHAPHLTPYLKDNELLVTSSYSVWREIVQQTDCFIESAIKITPSKDGMPSKTITHFHHDHWIDGSGGQPKQIAELARIALQAKKPMIHGVRGLGRAGTLAAVIGAYRKIKGGNHSPHVIKDAVMALRRERPGCVFRHEQYQSVYETVKILLEEDGLI